MANEQTFEDNDTFRYALGALQLRKKRNRKKSRLGEEIWDDRADLGLTMGLVTWTSSRAHRVGLKRSDFLQQYLKNCGRAKSRKQISSRLQVLKTEWQETDYLNLLKNPEDAGNPASSINPANPLQEQPILIPGVDQVSPAPSEEASNATLSLVSHSHETVPHDCTGIQTQPGSTDQGTTSIVDTPLTFPMDLESVFQALGVPFEYSFDESNVSPQFGFLPVYPEGG